MTTSPKHRVYFLLVLLLTLTVLLFHPAPVIDAHDTLDVFPFMHPDEATLQEWMAASDAAERTPPLSPFRAAASPEGSLDLLQYMVHIPSERSQGACGNCWVWAGTGCMELALTMQEGISERLSVQVVNSCRSVIGKSCCQGGWLYQLANFYNTTGRALPWTNTNAHWQDSDGGCSVPCGDIATEPYYTVVDMQMLTVPTRAPEVSSQAEAIANIKAVLDSGKGVWFAFFTPPAGWQQFTSFWLTQGESAAIDLDAVCRNGTSVYAGHAVLCVGYDDTNPDNRYWVMLNSWGTAGGRRPNGLFRINMDMDYNTLCGSSYPALHWQALDILFRSPPEVATGPASHISAQTATVHGTLTYNSGTATDVRFEYGVTAGGPYPNASPWQGGFQSENGFEADLSGLLPGTRYYYRAQASNGGGTVSGQESSFRTIPLPPAKFSAQANGENSATVTWQPGEGADTTVVWGKKGSPPDAMGDGVLVYEGSDTHVDDMELDPGSPYFYRAWSLTNDSPHGVLVSDESSQDCAHTIGNDVWMVGDVNLDGRASVVDAMFVAQHIVGLRHLDPIPLICADTTSDGLVNIIDAMQIAQFTVDPDGAAGILFAPLWQSPCDEGMLNPLSPCGA